MTAVPLLMGFHCHQPVGNFPSVFREACARCYGPLLEALAGAPSFRFSLHLSGPLLEWVEKEEPGLAALVRGLARRGQAELLTSGYYEPVLAALPRRDALGQVRLFSDHLEKISGVKPRGLWLTERVWDPSLVSLLAEAGLRYALVDDNHLRPTGIPPARAGGYFLTEWAGERTALFPISQRLRYLIPFHPVGEVVAAIASLSPGQAAVIFDDGEKFGLWPGTSEWVFGKGWLADFLAALGDSEAVAPMTYSEFMASHPPLGKVAVPPGSYREMEEWSLPPAEAESFRDLVAFLEGQGRGEQARRFVRGGTWPDFLQRYPESARLQAKMLGVSGRLEGWDLPRVRRHLYRGQCNDAYWHGIFGGLYLPVLRDGVTRELNRAERELDRALGLPGPQLADLDGDGFPEAVLRTPETILGVSAAAGGQAYELSGKEGLFDLASTLARRPELYHRAGPPAPAPGGEGVATIHQAVPAMSDRMRAELAADWYPRHCFIDHFFAPDASLEGFARCAYPEWGDFVDRPYLLSLMPQGVRAIREGGVFPPGGERIPARVEKEYRLAGRALSVLYRVQGGGAGSLFAVEVNLRPPGGEEASAAVDGRPLSLALPAEERGREVRLLDPSLPRPLLLALSREAGVWSFPLRTVSRSERGFDLTYQGSCLAFLVGGAPGPGGELSFTLELEF